MRPRDRTVQGCNRKRIRLSGQSLPRSLKDGWHKDQQAEAPRQMNLKVWSKAAEARVGGMPQRNTDRRSRRSASQELGNNAWTKVAMLSAQYTEYKETVFRGLGLGNEDVSMVLARGRVGQGWLRCQRMQPLRQGDAMHDSKNRQPGAGLAAGQLAIESVSDDFTPPSKERRAGVLRLAVREKRVCESRGDWCTLFGIRFSNKDTESLERTRYPKV